MTNYIRYSLHISVKIINILLQPCFLWRFYLEDRLCWRFDFGLYMYLTTSGVKNTNLAASNLILRFCRNLRPICCILFLYTWILVSSAILSLLHRYRLIIGRKVFERHHLKLLELKMSPIENSDA